MVVILNELLIVRFLWQSGSLFICFLMNVVPLSVCLFVFLFVLLSTAWRQLARVEQRTSSTRTFWVASSLPHPKPILLHQTNTDILDIPLFISQTHRKHTYLEGGNMAYRYLSFSLMDNQLCPALPFHLLKSLFDHQQTSGALLFPTWCKRSLETHLQQQTLTRRTSTTFWNFYEPIPNIEKEEEATLSFVVHPNILYSSSSLWGGPSTPFLEVLLSVPCCDSVLLWTCHVANESEPHVIVCRPRRTALLLAFYCPYDWPQKKTQRPQEMGLTSLLLTYRHWKARKLNADPSKNKVALWTYVVFSIGYCHSYSSVLLTLCGRGNGTGSWAIGLHVSIESWRSVLWTPIRDPKVYSRWRIYL